MNGADQGFNSATNAEQLQAHLAAIVATSDDAIISKDLNGIIRSWNNAAERIFGYKPEEIIGRSILTIIPPERQHEETHILDRLKRGERIDHFQTIRMRKDGRRVEISVTISPIKNSTGKVVGASKIARDTTEFNRALRARERLYELGKALSGELELSALVQKVTDLATEHSGAQVGAFFYNVKDERGETFTLCALSGTEREKFSQLLAPQSAAVFIANSRQFGAIRSDDVTTDPRFVEGIPPFMRSDALPIRSYLSTPVLSRGGEVLGALLFGHAQPSIFTEQGERAVLAIAGHAAVALDNARLYRELGDTAARFRQLANSIPQLAWMADSDGNVTWFNDRWYQYTGVARDQPLTQNWNYLVEPGELARVKEGWNAALREGREWEDTFPIRRHDGVFRWHLSRAVPLRNVAGNAISWFGTNTDVTDQMNLSKDREHLLAAERAARAEAERISRMKDEFLATLSHELRTPLNAILGWSQIIQGSRHDTETLHEGLGVIERNARMQTRLIEDLLDMSRIISGKIRLDVQRVDVASVVDAAIDAVKPAADAKGVQLRKSFDRQAGSVSGDSSRLQQVIWNLLSNAVKFTPRGGYVEVSIQRNGSSVQITISDSGKGIKAEFLPHVFERFRQADSATTRQASGLGLGLAIVKNLVELHGGQIHAKSQGEGKGASFTVSLPSAQSHFETASHKSGTSTSAAGASGDVALSDLKILVVEDEPDARHLIGRVLRDAGAQVILAESADDALHKLRGNRLDLVISDIGMPTKDGYTFMREVRSLSEDQGGKTPAVALTAFARSEDRTRAMMAGYQVHMSKPIEPVELVATAASLVGRTGKDT